MVLTRAFACATPVVASDIPGVQGGHDRRDRRARAAGRPRGRSPTRSSRCSRTSRAAGRWVSTRATLAVERYSWDTIAERLEQIYEEVAA